MSRPTLRTVLAIVVAVALTACTRPENASSGDESIPPAPTSATDSASTTTAPTEPTSPPSPASSTTIDAGASTVPASSAPTSTTADSTGSTSSSVAPPTSASAPEPLDDLTLIFDGVVPYRFGDRDVDVVPALADEFGPPVSDVVTEYPTADDGVFLDETGEEAFVAPVGRMVCYANSLCVQFGAGAPETLLFSGWRLDDSAPSDLATQDGIAIGSTLADHADVITFDAAVSCFQVAYGSAAGIDVTLVSDDGVFAAPSPDGDGLDLGDPDPALVTVQAMSAGELPVFLFADC